LLIKKTAKNQVTIPKALADQLPLTDHFEAEVENGALVLRPVRVVPLVDIDQVRARLKRSRVRPEDVQRAVCWARDKT
jgi:antitoxin component of MazEF toxin-antitoxin module